MLMQHFSSHDHGFLLVKAFHDGLFLPFPVLLQHRIAKVAFRIDLCHHPLSFIAHLVIQGRMPTVNTRGFNAETITMFIYRVQMRKLLQNPKTNRRLWIRNLYRRESTSSILRSTYGAIKIDTCPEASEEDRHLLRFYASQSHGHLQTLQSCVNTFLGSASSEPPRVFVGHGKQLVIAAHKLVFIGDTLGRLLSCNQIQAKLTGSPNAKTAIVILQVITSS
ncbi:unnamed protein product [Ranitomeya imitator]|uniref:CAS family C-terminal domain-containing protein n=1 Tax=Ranitomeya imitator TaxID=111125 RepID=A0ABN9LSL6_9NEOB|nr:unnamed protein product [Ranitomeya imitator]